MIGRVSPRHGWTSSVLASGLFLAGAVRFIWSGLLPATRGLRGDFSAVFPTAYFARLRPDFVTTAVWKGGWWYGPMLHFLTLPLFLVPQWSAVPKVWAATNLLALIACFVMTIRLSGTSEIRIGPTTTLLAALWLLYQPLLNCLAQGNIEIVELTLLLAAFVALQRAKGGLAGVLFGVATMTKYLPAGFLFWLLARRRGRPVAVALVTMAAIAAVTAVTLGWRSSATAQDLTWAFTAPIGSPRELSVTSMFVHMAGRLNTAEGTVLWFPTARVVPAALAGTLATVLLLAVCGLVLLRHRSREITSGEIATLFMVMLLVPPWNHDYYYIFALIPFSLLFLSAVARADRPLLVTTLSGYFLISFPIPYGWIDRMGWFTATFADVQGFFNVPLAGGLLLLVAAVREVLRLRPADIKTATRWRLPAWGYAVTALAIVAFTNAVVARASRPTEPSSAVTSSLTLTPASDVDDSGALAISPDGHYVAYVASAALTHQLCVRQLNASTTGACTDEAAGVSDPFFSPDGEWVGFFSGARLMKRHIAGGAAQLIATTDGGRMASWADDDAIVFTARAGIYRVPAAGGPPSLVVPLRPRETAYLAPIVLSHTDIVVYTVSSGIDSVEDGVMFAESWRPGPPRTRLFPGQRPHYDASTRRLLYAWGGRLLAVPFSPASLTPTGAAVTLVDKLRTTSTGGGQFAVGDETLVFAEGGAITTPRTLVWVDRQGRELPLPLMPAGFESPRLSPDGRVVLVAARGLTTDLWTYDLDERTETRATFGETRFTTPLWTPDGRRLTFATASGQPTAAYTLPFRTPGAQTLLLRGQPRLRLGSWSPDGRFLAGTQPGPETGQDVVVFDAARKQWRTMVQTKADDQSPAFSPDGRWLAYVSDESGRSEVYVQDFPQATRRIQVSSGGGTEPLWRRDGGELYYRSDDRFMARTVIDPAAFAMTAPHVLFRDTYERGQTEPDYDVSLDGGRFLMVRGDPAPAPPPLYLVHNWPALE